MSLPPTPSPSPPPPPPPPPNVNLSENEQGEIVRAIIATWALAVIAVFLRYVSRRLARARLWLDDFLIIPPLIFATILCFISTIWMIRYGLGKHIWVAPQGAVPVFLQGLFISELTYTGVLVFVKFSILALYWRIFRVRRMQIAIYVVATLVTCWGVAVLLATLFQCVPLRGFWDKSVKADCGVDDYKFFLGNSIPNICTDVAILILPMRSVWTLKISRSQKISLTIIFILGGFVSAVSITRLIYLYNLDLTSIDVTWNFGVTQIWTCVEMNIAIVSACLPSMRPILSFILTGSSKPSDSQRKLIRQAHSPTSWSHGNAVTSATVRGGKDALSVSSDSAHLVTRASEQEQADGLPDQGSTATTHELQEVGGRKGISIKSHINVQWHNADEEST